MSKTVIAVLAWYIIMIILEWSTPEEHQEPIDDKPKEPRSLLDNPLLAACGMPPLYEDVEAVEECELLEWKAVEYNKSKTQHVVIDITKPLKQLQ